MQKVLLRDAHLLRYVLVFDFWAPETYVKQPGTERVALQLYSKDFEHLSHWGKLATGLWAALLLAAAGMTIRHKMYARSVILGLLLCLFYNLVLHTIYGDDLFLYSCNTCFLLVAWVMLCLAEIKLRPLTLALDGALLLLVLLEATNNFRFAEALVSQYYPA